MNRQEFMLASGQRVTVDIDGISFYGPHESGSGTLVVAGGYADGLHLHFADTYATVRAALTKRDDARLAGAIYEFDHAEQIARAEEYARAVERDRAVGIHLLNAGSGLRIEVETSDNHAEDQRSWSELVDGPDDQLERMIDELVTAVKPAR